MLLLLLLGMWRHVLLLLLPPTVMRRHSVQLLLLLLLLLELLHLPVMLLGLRQVLRHQVRVNLEKKTRFSAEGLFFEIIFF